MRDITASYDRPALCIADADIIFCSCRSLRGFFRLSSSFFFSSPILSGRRLDVYHTSTRDVAVVRILNAGLKCAARGSLKIQNAKKSPKNRHLRLRTIAQLCWAISLQLRHVLTIEKNLLNSNASSTRPGPNNMVNFSPLTADIGSLVGGTPANFNRFHLILGVITAPTSLTGVQPNFARPRCLTVSMRWYAYYIGHTFSGALNCPLTEFCQVLPGAKFILRPSFALSFVGSVTARQSSSGRQPNFAAFYKEWNYRPFAEGATYIRHGGHHVGHRPTFQFSVGHSHC